MNVLLIDSTKGIADVFSHLVQDLKATSYVVESHQEAVSLIAAAPIDVVIFTLQTLADVELLHYLNTSHPGIKVFLTVAEPVRQIVSTLKDGHYEVMPTFCRLSELHDALESVTSAQETG
ncbi:hypothetical protein GF339_02340 [candidate division KSB3 bacterium]|uniref:Response regulatory domain-containing protein n=1 Tax=candidate division KSB3 bacterium TaxID=2044937 RepID=A0A9D5JSX3_9BACT|nr:hypothetical protein [candidate division KSB3 bacterium]MBD3323392.1 hypothetical protein [candidate division KSB3 bacterium]